MTRDEVMHLVNETSPRYASWGCEAHFQNFAQRLIQIEREACIKILEAYQIPLGNSCSGELAADWTYDALKQVRDDIRARGGDTNGNG